MSFEVKQINSIYKGCIYGPYMNAALFGKECEVYIKKHKKGEDYPAHVHHEADEWNYVIRGILRLNDTVVCAQEYCVVPKGVVVKPMFLEDCIVVVVKKPAIPGDKEEVDVSNISAKWKRNKVSVERLQDIKAVA